MLAPVSGILNVDKPKGMTSHDVVDQVRRLAQERRVGHAGTLDPMATGVLIICLGKATRLAEYLANSDKSYLATIVFGITTDTWDAEGKVLMHSDGYKLALDDIQSILAGFLGRIEQIPPMYSALKREGQPLYRLARRGLEVERAPRRVEIYAFQIVRWQAPELVLRVDCSKGTYIRTLAHDLGQAAHVGAYLADLRRLAVGHFRVEEAVALDELLRQAPNGAWQKHLRPVEAALGEMPGAIVEMGVADRIRHGQAVNLPLPGYAGVRCAAYDQNKQLVAILAYDVNSGLWRPDKVLATF